MERHVIYKIGVIILVVLSILGTLFATTKMPNENNNGFDRNFVADRFEKIGEIPVKEDISKIGGISDHSLFLIGQDPRTILIINKKTHERDTILIHVNIPTKQLVPFYVYVDTPMIYLHLNNQRRAIYGMFPGQPLKLTEVQSSIFTKSVQISANSFIIRTFDGSLSKQIFQKIDIKTGQILKEAYLINDQDSSGGLSSDGMFCYDERRSVAFYVEYLRNRFYCIDSNLNLVYQANTIDTTSSINVEMKDQMDRTGKIKKVASIARVTVNKEAFLDDNYLYVLSGLRADNEKLNEFNRYSAIDIYNKLNGKYVGSLHMEKSKANRFTSAMIMNDTLWTLYKNEVISYRIPGISHSK